MNVCIEGMKKIPCGDDRNYLGLPDGYRLIFEGDKYVGRYNPNLPEPI